MLLFVVICDRKCLSLHYQSNARTMKKEFMISVIGWFMMPMMLFGQTYSALWKKVETAEKKDLPKSQYELLQKIVNKAAKEKAYGQLLKAELQAAQVMQSIAPDSIVPAVKGIQKRCDATVDPTLKVVYQTVLWRVWRDNWRLHEEDEDGNVPQAPEKPVLTPERCVQLAQVKAEMYQPFVITREDSKLFNHDLLSVVGYELNTFEPLYNYYKQTSNREAACLTGLEMYANERSFSDPKAYIQVLDSLIGAYGDLPVCGEVAIERYDALDRMGATPKEKLDYIGEALNKWTGWKRLNSLRNARERLTQSQYEISTDRRVVMPMRPQTFKLKALRNISQLTMKVYPLKAKGDIDLNPNYDNDFKKIKPLMGTMVKEVQRTYTGHKNYEFFEDSFPLEGLPVGVYMLEFSSKEVATVRRCLYFVTDVFLMAEPQPKNGVRYVVVCASTGQPIPNAHLTLRERISYNKEKTHEVTTDAKGEYLFQGDNYVYEAFAYTDTDQACPILDRSNRYSYTEYDKNSLQTVVYTDRAIYRPGQTLHASAIVYRVIDGISHEAVKAKQVTFTLRDANYKVVKEINVTTDDYGTCAADFTLPSSGLTGRFTIQAGSARHTVRVEEYKRPTFEVTFPEKVTQDYKAGDTVSVKGIARSYAGVPVQGAKVSYTVTRRMSFWWLSYYRYYSGGFFGTGSDETEVFSGEALTESDGSFTIQMPMTLPETQETMFYQFVAKADVTDQAGETHEGQFVLPLGNRKTALGIDVEEKVLLESKPVMTFHLRNAAGNDMEAEVKYRLDEGKWLASKTGKAIAIAEVAKKSGQHLVEAVCGNDTVKRSFVVFSLEDKTPAIETDDWFYVSANQFPNDGKPVTVQVGSSAKDVYMVYSIFSGEKVIEQGTVSQSNALLNRKLTYKEEWGDGIHLTFAWVKEGKCHVHNSSIERPLPDKHLSLQWKTFRDRLTPGQQEEWTLTILKNGKPVEATLMATMYDKSLDQLTSHHWLFSPRFSLTTPFSTWSSISLRSYSDHVARILTNYISSGLSFSTFDESVYPSPYRSRRHFLMRASRGMKTAMVEDALESAPMVAMAGNSSAAMDEAAPIGMNGAVLKKEMNSSLVPGTKTENLNFVPDPSVQLRENLNETAFFYPQLTSDAEGRVALKFTLPESLTTWRFMGLAHTKDMSYGLLTGESVAKKDVMIQPNMPRFIREGDEAVITARIFNTAGKPIQGTATLRLLNPETEQLVYETSQSFESSPDETTSVSFPLTSSIIPLTSSIYICQVLATGTNFSDGEQHYLPILPSTERVTITRPFTQIRPGTLVLPLGDGSFLAKKSTITDKKLTIEYTNNPAWLMVQALPSLGTPIDDNAISQTASFYANSLGRYMVSQHPKLQTVFNLWKTETSSETSLMSALEKNQDLKDLVLNETPWVLDADRESEQKQRLADFFDENLMNQRLSKSLGKMQALQRADGSWSWWPDMPGSFYMTVEITEMLVRLNALTGPQKETASMLDKAFKFMGREIIDLVKEVKKEKHPTFPSFKALQWLYLCALDGRTLSNNVQAANHYLLPLLKKDIKSQSIYEKAMTAVILSKYPDLKDKDRSKGLEYVQSLKEYTVYREDMGRYYDTPRAGYSWYSYKIPTQTMALEALQNITPDDQQTIQEMQRWLLQEKRTQTWDTPINSVNAIYAFLHGQGILEEMDAPLSVLKVDGQPLETPQATAALGYIKTTIPADSKTLTIEKTSNHTSWGAVYAQFTQKTSEIEQSSSGITVRRELLKNGQPVTMPLSVGDRITVRLTITVDRDLDFVQVQDKRAACLEPVRQLSGYYNGAYCTPRDNATNYYYHGLAKGRHIIETDYFIDRPGTYETGTCTVQCAYAPEFRGTTYSQTINVK